MRTILFYLVFACGGTLFAQAPAFVDDWEGAPDKMKIRANDRSEYATTKPEETNTNKVRLEKPVAAKKKTAGKNRKKLALSSKKKRVVKVSEK